MVQKYIAELFALVIVLPAFQCAKVARRNGRRRNAEEEETKRKAEVKGEDGATEPASGREPAPRSIQEQDQVRGQNDISCKQESEARRTVDVDDDDI